MFGISRSLWRDNAGNNLPLYILVEVSLHITYYFKHV